MAFPRSGRLRFLLGWDCSLPFSGLRNPWANRRPPVPGKHGMVSIGECTTCGDSQSSAFMLTHFFGQTGAARFSVAFLRSSTIYFLFISGYLCQYLANRRKVDTGQYYLAKLKNVISPYVVCSFATMAAVCLLQGHRVCVISPAHISIRSVPNILLLGWAQRQYWYIPFVVVLFLVSPWLTRIGNRSLLWLLVVSFFTAVCLPWRPPSYMTWHPGVALYRYVYFSWGYLLGFAYARWKAQIDPHLHAYAIPALLLGTLLGFHEMFPASIPSRFVLSGSFAWTLQNSFSSFPSSGLPIASAQSAFLFSTGSRPTVSPFSSCTISLSRIISPSWPGRKKPPRARFCRYAPTSASPWFSWPKTSCLPLC